MRATIALLALLSGPPAGAASPEGGRGLWVGPIPVCRDTAASVAAGADLAGRPTVTVTLTPQWRERLQRETERLVGKPLAVRLDGRIVSAPTVLEPITGGVLQLAGLSAREAAAVAAAARRAC
jgi:preprotein translocase subunit SecD